MVSGLRLKAQSPAAVTLMAAMFSGAMLLSPMLLTSKSSNLTVFAMLPAQVQEQSQGVFSLAPRRWRWSSSRSRMSWLCG
jgi:divalent anion:Na+ symporter, DASS family